MSTHRQSRLFDDEPRPFWPARLFGLLVAVVVAYFAAAFFFVVLTRISEMPSGPLWVSDFQGPLFFILLMVAAGILSVPYFQKEAEPGLRTLSLFTATFLVAYSVFRASGVIDPDIPLDLVNHYAVIPLRAMLGL